MATSPKPQAPWGDYVAHVGAMRVEQFEQFPGEDGWRYELHAGRLIVMPGPGNQHGGIQARFFLTLGLFIQQQQLGLLSGTKCYNLPLPGNTEELLCPDLSYVLPLRKAAMKQRGSYLVGAPDLVIEIASPGDTHPETVAKTAIYLRAGVRLIWNIWPKARSIEVWRQGAAHIPTSVLNENDHLDGLDVIPGFQCLVRDLLDG
jgi:Uma2 family endonuclease